MLAYVSHFHLKLKPLEHMLVVNNSYLSFQTYQVKFFFCNNILQLETW